MKAMLLAALRSVPLPLIVPAITTSYLVALLKKPLSMMERVPAASETLELMIPGGVVKVQTEMQQGTIAMKIAMILQSMDLK